MRFIGRSLRGRWSAVALLIALAVSAAPGGGLAAAAPGGGEGRPPANFQKVYRSDDEIVRWVRAILQEQGRGPLFASGPYSGAELRRNLARVDRAALSPAGRALYDRADSALHPAPWLEQRLPDGRPVLGFDAGLELNLEWYLQANTGETAWLYGYERRRPLLSIPFELWALESAYATIDLTLRKNYYSFDQYMTRKLRDSVLEENDGEPQPPATPNPDPRTNFPSELEALDPQFPFRSFVAAGGEFWSAQLGRDVISWGPGESGTLVVSDYAEYHEALRFTAFFERLKYTYFWINAEGITTDENDESRRRQRNFIGHRLEFRPIERLNVAVNEVYLIAKEAMELRHLQPVMVFHNHFIDHRDSSIIAGLEIDFAPAPGWRLYGEYAFNSLMLETLHGDSVDDDPNAWGALVGIERRFPRRVGYLVSALEAVYTNPWLYTHDRHYTSLTHSRRLQTEHLGVRAVTVEKPLGYWAGPDFVGLFVRLAYERPAAFEALARASLQGKGQRDLFLHTFDEFREDGGTGRSPTGPNPEWRAAVELEGEVRPGALWPELRFTPFGGELTLGSHLAGLWTWNRRRPGEGQRSRPLAFDLQWAGWVSLRW